MATCGIWSGRRLRLEGEARLTIRSSLCKRKTMTKIRFIFKVAKFFLHMAIHSLKGRAVAHGARRALGAAGMLPVAGIEAVVIDGKLHYYGYSYSADEVVSPLFPTAESMTTYAAKYLLQSDGKHPAHYWMELAQEAAKSSDLFGDVPHVRTADFDAIGVGLQAAALQGTTVDHVQPCIFMRDILVPLAREDLGAQAWAAAADVLEKNDLDSSSLGSNDAQEFLNRVFREESEYSQVSVQDAAILALAYLKAVQLHAEDGWRELLTAFQKTPMHE